MSRKQGKVLCRSYKRDSIPLFPTENQQVFAFGGVEGSRVGGSGLMY